MTCRRFLLLVALLAPLAVAQTAPTSRPALDDRLADLDRRAAAYGDLAGRFKQTKTTALLAEPIVTTGEFFARGDVMRWQNDGSQGASIRVAPDGIEMYYPSQRRVEVFPMLRELSGLAASPQPRLAALRASFDIAEEPVTLGAGGTLLQLKLTPRDAATAKNVAGVRVLLDADRAMTRVFELADPDGDATRVEFLDVRADTKFDDAKLRTPAPPGTRIVRPLGPP